MKWFLIMIFLTNPVRIETLEFSSELACTKARNFVLVESMIGGRQTIKVECYAR